MNHPSQILIFLVIFHQFDAAFSRFHKVYPHHKRFDYQLQSVDLNQMNEIIQEITNLNKLTSSNLTPEKLPNEFDPTTNSISSNPGEISSYSPTYTQSGSTSSSSGQKNPASIPDLNTSNSHSKDKSGEVRSNQTTNSSPNSGVPKTKDCDTLNPDRKETTSVNGKNQTTNTSRKNPITIPNLNVSKENSKNESSLTEDQSDSDNPSEHTTDSLEDSDSSETEQEASGSSNPTNPEDKPSKSSNTSNPKDCDKDQDNKAGKIKQIVNTNSSTIEKGSKSPTSQNSPQRLPTGSGQLLHHSGNEINPSHQIQSPNEEFGGNYV